MDNCDRELRDVFDYPEFASQGIKGFYYLDTNPQIKAEFSLSRGVTKQRKRWS